MVFNHAGFWQSVISANVGMGLLKISIAFHLLRLNPGRWYAMILWASIGMYSLLFMSTIRLPHHDHV
jgi:hypothetical protein